MVQQVSRMSVRGQTVIPQDLRDALGIRPGTRLSWSASGGSLLVTPETADPVRSSRGLLRGVGPTTASLLAARRRDRQAESTSDTPRCPTRRVAHVSESQ